MEYTYSLQKLAAYQSRKTKKSKATFDAGLALLNRGGFSGKGEEGTHYTISMLLSSYKYVYMQFGTV